MSQSERGETSAAGQRPSRATRPSLDRPSLFAGMEDDHSDPAAAKRVRILSTLEAPRTASRKGGLRPPASAHRSPGRSWALWALMGGGLVCAAGGLWLSSMADEPDPAPRQAIARAVAPAASVGTTPAASAPTVTSAARAMHPDAPLTALIESSPPGAPASVPMQAPAPAAAEASAADTANPLALLSTTPASSPSRAKAQAASIPVSPKLSKVSKAPPGKGKTGPSDDVALLEAMFAHAGHRKPPRSASEELERRCGPLNGAEARACRTKVCKRYPDARVCR